MEGSKRIQFIMPKDSRGVEARHVNVQSQTLVGMEILTHVMATKQKFSLEKKNRLNISVLKSDVIAGEIKESSQQMKQSYKLVHNTQIKLKHSAYQLLWRMN